MILGIGTDLVEIARIRTNYLNLASRILSAAEYAVFEKIANESRKVEFLAGRFAAKEAYAKARGTGIGDISFREIEVLNDERGKPYINIKDETNIFVSISHAAEYANAFVVIESQKG